MGTHAFFIAFSYALTALVIAALALHAVIDHRMQVRALTELESRGVSRRSRRG